MPMTESIALVGGPADGEILIVTAGMTILTMRLPTPALWATFAPWVNPEPKYARFTYRRSGRSTREGRAVFEAQG